MAEDKYFYYQDSIDINEANVSYLEIRNICSEEELYGEFDDHFNFPYFGFNWDALRDSLCGLEEWLEEKTVVIFHKNLPQLAEHDLKIYITVLYDVCEIWEMYPNALIFKVYFPKKDQGIIQSILKHITPRLELS